MAVDHTRDARVVQVLLAILGANAAVAAAKITYGTLFASLAIRADGLHSLLDGINNIVAVIVVQVAARPPDTGHPYGHRKFEVLGSVAIGVMILWMVLHIGADALQGVVTGVHPELGPEAYAVMAATLAINLGVTIVEHRAGRRLNSPLLIADARHTLSDVFVTAAVLAGVAGVRAGFDRADALSALAVLVPVSWVGYGILRQGVAALSDEVMIPAAEVRDLVRTVAGVRQCRRVRSRGAPGEVRMDLIVEVDPQMTVAEAHLIADRVQDKVRDRWPEVAEVVVHIEPEGGPGT